MKQLQACEVNEVWLYFSEVAKLHIFLDVQLDYRWLCEALRNLIKKKTA